MKKILLYFILLILSFQNLFAQEKGTKPVVEYTTIGHYKYTNYTNREGSKPQVGDYVYFHAQIRKKNNIISSSREYASKPFVKINELDLSNLSPVEIVLRELTKGDSATIEILIDTLPELPKGFEGEQILYYDVVVVDILDEAGYQEKLADETTIQEKEIETLKEKREEVAQLTQTYLDAYNTNILNQLQTTASGLQYLLLEEGTGSQSEAGKQITVHYYGLLTDGISFDDSFQRGKPFSVQIGLGRVIQGWEEGLTLFKEGARFILFIPPSLGYGEAGALPSIPSNSKLVFYIELLKVR